MTTSDCDEGQLVDELIYGRGERPRSTAPEPSLLPQLGTRLCHDFSLNEVLDATLEFSRHATTAPPWPPLWEATLWGIAGRRDMQAKLDSLDTVSPNHWQVLRTLHAKDRRAAAALAGERIDLGYPYPDAAGAARLAPLLSRSQVESLLRDPEVDPLALDPESARSLLAAANANSLQVGEPWIAAALNGSWQDISTTSRLAHILPDLPPALRTKFADELARWLTSQRLPPDMRALWVSRIAPFAPPDAWGRDALLDDLPAPWRQHTISLLSAFWPAEPWGDVFRSHPENERILEISRPHETTVAAPNDILMRWGALETAAVARSSSGAELEGGAGPFSGGAFDFRMGRRTAGAGEDHTGATDDAATAGRTPPDTRRLQADVEHRASNAPVNAFVANSLHLVDISIGRGGQVRATAEIEDELQKEFDRTDADTIELPVWFHADQQPQKSSIRVPRDTTRNSSKATFTFTAPASGRALPRIHVMLPGGHMLLQSAVLVGDVVAEADAAKTHSPGFELNVDVVAGNLHDPAEPSGGRTFIADQQVGLTEENGVLLEVDIASIQQNLGELIHEFETAADQQDVNDKAIEDVLVRAAKVGQQYRVLFETQLRELAAANPLQIVSLRRDDVLPLELVYDGPPLAVDSGICPTWRDALRAGNCGGCSGGGPGNEVPARVCPMRFWSMSKVIERRTADARGGAFRVQAERSGSRQSLRPIDAVVVAASGRVAGSDVVGLKQFAAAQLHIPAETAGHWEDWKSVIANSHPELLVAMPHNEAEAGALSSKLLLGEPDDDATPVPSAAALLSGSVTNEYVQSSDDLPGPIVLLLGCDTQFQKGQISGFAGEFRQRGAAATIATFGELRADQAPLAARVLIEKIVRPRDDETTLGHVMLSARRQLLSDNLIMALLLVANGDANWLLSK
jgi:hypothetical protein